MVNIYELKLTNLQQRIFRLMCVKAGSELNALRIAKILKVSQPAVSKALPLLERESLIKIEKDKLSGRFSIELNRDNRSVIQLKRTENLKMIYESGLADHIEKEFAGATVILFGSYSKGEDTVNSDIDIAIIGRKSKKVDLDNYHDLLGREINLNFYDSFDEIHKNLKENLFSGIVLCGSIEL